MFKSCYCFRSSFNPLWHLIVKMKLGLLVVLAVVALVPSLSESRIVSRCELKERLGDAIHLPRRLQRFKEKILAIGEFNKWWVCVSRGFEKSNKRERDCWLTTCKKFKVFILTEFYWNYFILYGKSIIQKKRDVLP